MMINTQQLLQDKRVQEEINRHKWLESEKAGHDIGFDRAAKDWMKRYAADWLKKNGDKSISGSRKK